MDIVIWKLMVTVIVRNKNNKKRELQTFLYSYSDSFK